MNCRTGWNREFIDANLTKTFRAGPWRDHKKQMILNREKAILPTFQKYAAAKKKYTEVLPLRDAARKVLSEADAKKHEIDGRMNSYVSMFMKKDANIEDLFAKHKADAALLPALLNDNLKKTLEYRLLDRKFTRHYNIYYDIDGSGVPSEKKEFIMKCVKDGCRGFLSQAYKCELCSTYACKDCLIAKHGKNDETHVCKKEDVDSVALIRKETRPCPKCGIRISKIDGCDQMWCTADGCDTAFSWITNKIISGVIHNPHYYEWLRRNNNGVAPRPPGEIQCGGVPHWTQLFTPMRSLMMPQNFPKLYTQISNIHQSLSDIEHVRIQQYTPVRDALMYKDIHVDYLLNAIDEETWVQKMFNKENSNEKKSQIGLIMQTFLNAGCDLMRTLIGHLTPLYQKKILSAKYLLNAEDMVPIIATLEEFEKLRSYINDSLAVLGKNMMCAVPQYNEEWRHMTASRIDKVKPFVAVAAPPPLPTAAPPPLPTAAPLPPT